MPAEPPPSTSPLPALTVRRHSRIRRFVPYAPTVRGVAVETDEVTYLADRVVVATDMCTNGVLEGAGVRLTLTITQEQSLLRDAEPP